MPDFPSRLFDQHFGLQLADEDFIPASMSPYYYRPRRQIARQNSKGTSEIACGSDNFKISLDVSQFAPNEITVKAIDDNVLTIEAKHEERADEHGFVSRQFVRKYMLPKDIDLEKISSSLSADGVLSVSAPKKAIEAPKANEKVIPVAVSPAPAAAMVAEK